MNNNTIQSDLFKRTFESFWKYWKLEVNNFDSKKEWWEITKVKIKNLCIEISKKLNVKERDIKNLEAKLGELLENEVENTPEILNLKEKIKLYYDKQSEAARIRSKINWYEKGEKSTKYFFDLEKKRGVEKLWTRIKTDDGHYKDDIDSILAEQFKFYQNLFSSEGWDIDAANMLIQNVESKLCEDDKLYLDSTIELEEIEKAVQEIKPEKSPGEDGIIGEFYKSYWYLIKEHFVEVISEIFSSNQLADSQYKGIITLLYKNGEREDIKNWRPITLLNVDYKIVSKILANRLKQVLPKIIDSDQKGFVQGRQIFEGNRLLQDIIDYVDMTDDEGAIIFLDQQKAFDRSEWGWVDLCTDHFNFGQKFRDWISMLFKYAKTCIQTNGFTSKFMTITRSLRQGCPVAPMLYILQAEPLAATIRSNKKIVGFKLPNSYGLDIEAKLNMFADDTQILNKTEESIDETFRILGIYESASGAKMNFNKTVGMFLGKWRNKKPRFKNIHWTKNPVKALGVMHGYNVDIDTIWLDKIKKNQELSRSVEDQRFNIRGKSPYIKVLCIVINWI